MRRGMWRRMWGVRRMTLTHGTVGVAWRPETAWLIHKSRDLAFTEVIAESIEPRSIPAPLLQLRDRGVTVIPHGISLSLGGAEPPAPRRLDHLALLAERFASPFVSEHVAFVRAGGIEAGHLLPVARSHEMLDILVENIRAAQRALPVPLALENIATLFEWPESELDEASFLSTLVERTGVLLLLDVANLVANCHNHGWQLEAFLDELPLEHVAYVHVAGGALIDALYHDTHAHAVPGVVFDALDRLAARGRLPPVLLERDRAFGDWISLEREVDGVISAVQRGQELRRRAG